MACCNREIINDGTARCSQTQSKVNVTALEMIISQ